MTHPPGRRSRTPHERHPSLVSQGRERTMKLAPRMIAGGAFALLAAGMLAACGDTTEPEDSMSPSASTDTMMEEDDSMTDDDSMMEEESDS